jgi:hypothetical protein
MGLQNLAICCASLRLLALQSDGRGTGEPITPDEWAAYAMIPIIIILGLAIIAAGLWMTIDAWINYGPGWSIGAGTGCLLGTLGCGVGGCLVIIPYVIIRFLAYPPSRMREARAMNPPGASYRPGSPPPAIDLDLAPDERDSSLDELIAEGRLREAMGRAQELLKMARDFHDSRGAQRYSKYVERIRRGMR